MEVKPFKAFRFNKDVVGDVGSCISPPYDIIDDDQREDLYKSNEYNIIRIIKGKTTPSDSESNNQYTRAAEFLSQWLQKGVLKQDTTENFYAYVQNFEALGQNYQRSGFIGLAKVEEFGKTIKAHEQTLTGPKTDRLKLQLATDANFGLIFMLYADPKKVADKIIDKAMSQAPLIDFADWQEVRHRIYAISSKDDIKAIEKGMLDKSCVIADGHHRYETALNYYKQTGNPKASHQMMVFANTHNEGMIVLATHRLVNNLPNFDGKKFIEKLSENFEITKFPFDAKTKPQAKKKMLAKIKDDFAADRNAFGIYTADGNFYVAVLTNKKAMDKIAPDKSQAWRSLDVSILHKLIIEQTLGLSEEKVALGGNLQYVKDTANAIDDSIAKVDAGEKQIAFLTNPPKMEQIQNVADAGEKMPQKSTYFYPKMFTGLTVNKM